MWATLTYPPSLSHRAQHFCNFHTPVSACVNERLCVCVWEREMKCVKERGYRIRAHFLIKTLVRTDFELARPFLGFSFFALSLFEFTSTSKFSRTEAERNVTGVEKRLKKENLSKLRRRWLKGEGRSFEAEIQIFLLFLCFLDLGSISPTFHTQFLHAQIPKGQKRLTAWRYFMHFLDLRT